MNLLAVALIVLAPAARADDDAKKALDALQGDWRVVESVKDGHADDKAEFAEMRVAVKGDKIIATKPGKDKEKDREETFTVALNPKAEPKGIDLTPAAEKVTFKGIYKHEKDRLTICYSFEGAAPKDFKSEAKSNTGLLVLERAKK